MSEVPNTKESDLPDIKVTCTSYKDISSTGSFMNSITRSKVKIVQLAIEKL